MRKLVWDMITNVMIAWPIAAVVLGFFYDPPHARHWLVMYLAVWTALDVIRFAWRAAGLRWRWPIYRDQPELAMVLYTPPMTAEEVDVMRSTFRGLPGYRGLPVEATRPARRTRRA